MISLEISATVFPKHFMTLCVDLSPFSRTVNKSTWKSFSVHTFVVTREKSWMEAWHPSGKHSRWHRTDCIKQILQLGLQ